MPHRSPSVRRVVPSIDRVSFELPPDGTDDVAAQLLSPLALTPPAPKQLLETQNEADEEYAQWLERYPHALRQFAALEARLRGKRIAVFLDYDGTLTPIVRNPDRAFMSDEMRKTVRELAELYPTAIISGRAMEKVRQFVRLEELYYAGSHGLDIYAPDGRPELQNCACLQPAADLKPLINALYDRLREAVKHIHGAHVEHNTFCLSVHFRNCHEESWDEIKAIVKEAIAAHEPLLKSSRGRKVLDVRPRLDWGKGKAVEHFLKTWSYTGQDVVPLYLGDDRTDEDAFQYLKGRDGGGIGILVSSKAKPSEADYSLPDPAEVLQFLKKLVSWGRTHGGPR